MNISFTFRNVESSEGIKNYATEKIAKIQKYLRTPLDAEVTLFVERHLHCVDISVNGDGRRYAGHEESEDMYASIDMVIDKIDRQVREAKHAKTSRKRHSYPTADVAAAAAASGEPEAVEARSRKS